MAEGQSSILTEHSWENARSYATVLGQVPSSFSVVIRSMMNDVNSQQNEMSAATRYGVIRLLKSPTLYAPLYHALKLVSQTPPASNPLPSEGELAKQFNLFELAALIGFLYFFKRAHTLCEQEEFAFISEQVVEDASLGLLLGRAIPAIGGGTGLLEATIPTLGLACVLKHDPPGFTEYRRILKRTKAEWSTELEMERWGCSRIQIGSIILQLLGFGIPRANALLKGLASSAPISTADATDIAQDVRMAALWRHATKHTGKAPEVALPAKYYPNGNDYRHVINRLTQIRNEPPSPSWIKALKEDLPTPLEGDTTDSFAQQVEQE